MNDNKVPQKGGFNMVADKDFFADTESGVPHKPEIPSKPAEAPVPQKTIHKKEEFRKTAPLPKPVIPPTNSAEATAKKPLPPLSETLPKPFESTASGLAPLRTYRQDVAGVMRDKKTSLVQMVLEEQKERNQREREQSPSSKKNLPLILLSVFFLFSTVGVVYYIFFKINPLDHTLQDLQVTPIIFVEKNKEIAVEGKDSRAITKEIVNEVQGAQLKVDAAEYLFFTETTSTKTPDGVVQKKNLIHSDRFFETLGIKMPPMLLRSLRPDFMLGIHSFNKNQPFLILKTDYYDNAFAGMLAWEPKLAEDVLPLFGRADRVAELSQRKWDDTVIKNKDTRVLRNFDGSIALIYTFKDQRTLIISTGEDTLLEVSRRLDLAQEKRPN